jgi:hypothetical protein
MDTGKDKTVIANRRNSKRAPANIQHNVQVVQTSLSVRDALSSDLSIADDPDFGGDPYNSTGQYCIIKAKENFSR